MKILVVEDDRETATYLTKGLSESERTVCSVSFDAVMRRVWARQMVADWPRKGR